MNPPNKTGSQSFDDGFSLNPASELKPIGFYAPESVLEADAAEVGTLTQSELDLRTQERITEGQSLSPSEARSGGWVATGAP